MNEAVVHHDAGMDISGLLRMSGVKYVNHEAAGVLLGGLACGVLGLLVLFSALWCKILDIREVTVLKASLIFSCILQAVSTAGPAMAVLGFTCQLDYCHKLTTMWTVYGRCVVLLHLVVALEFIKTNQFHGRTRTVPPNLSVTVVLIINFLCIAFYDVPEAVLTVGAIALALTCWLIRARCLATSEVKPLTQVMCLAFVTFAGTYCPSFVLECIIFNGNSVSTYLHAVLLCLTNLCLVTSACLCWVTCWVACDKAPDTEEIISNDLPQARL